MYRAGKTHHLAASLALKGVFSTDLPPTIRTVQCGRPVAQEKLATENVSFHAT
jgi:hypothetical protein